jgi:flagellar motor switch/type III secretory pathway protein FliN
MAAAAQPKTAAAAAVAAPAAAVPVAVVPAAPSNDPWVRVDPLPCLLTIEISVPGFTVADLVNLEPGRVIATRWTVGQDVPLRINDALIAWSEFEVVQNRLAVRLTELA